MNAAGKLLIMLLSILDMMIGDIVEQKTHMHQ